jgi:hypothetical protein
VALRLRPCTRAKGQLCPSSVWSHNPLDCLLRFCA